MNLVSTVTRAVHSGTIYSSGLVSLQMDTADTFCILLDTKSFVSTVTRALHSGYTHIFAPTHIYSDTEDTVVSLFDTKVTRIGRYTWPSHRGLYICNICAACIRDDRYEIFVSARGRKR